MYISGMNPNYLNKLCSSSSFLLKNVPNGSSINYVVAKSAFSYSNSSKTTIIKKLCKSKKLSNDRLVIQKNPLQITSDLQRVFPYDHSVI